MRYPEIFHSLEVVHQAGNPSRVRLFTAMYSSVNRSTVHTTPISWKILARPRICRISCPNTLTKSCPTKKSGSGARSACSRKNDSQRSRLYVRHDSVDTRTPRIYRNFGSLMSKIHPAYRFSSSRRTATRSAASSHSHRGPGSG